MAVSLTSTGISFPDSSTQSKRAQTYNSILTGSFTVSWNTWFNLFNPSDHMSDGYYAIKLNWGYDYSYYSGLQHINTQAGFFQMPSKYYSEGTGYGVFMNGQGCYGENAVISFNNYYPVSKFFQVYVSYAEGGGLSGYIPNAGGTAYWTLYSVTTA